MINIDFYAAGIEYRETKDKVYFCAMLESSESGIQVAVRHFLAGSDQDAAIFLKTQEIEDPETGYYKRFSEPVCLKPVLDQLNMVISDEGSLSVLEED